MNGFNLSEWLQRTLGLLPDSQWAIAYTVIIVLALWLARRLLLRAVESRLVEDSGVMLTMRYLTEPQSRRSRAQAMWEDVLAALGERDDIDFAYPTTRYYYNAQEGKSGTVKSAGPGAPPPAPGHFD
jgi:hypothetical protein